MLDSDSESSIKRGFAIRRFALFMGAGIMGIAIGGCFGDIDHLFKGESRTWGHDWHFLAIIYSGVFIALACRQIYMVLKKHV